MIRENLIDTSFNRLAEHFGAHLFVHPPVTAADLAKLERVVGSLPREYDIFLLTTNGLRIHADGPETELHLWSSQESLASVVSGPETLIPPGLLPIKGDPTGERDWLVVEPCPVRGAIVRWDPWIPEAQLVASGLGTYFSAWTRFVTRNYSPEGKHRPTEDRDLFNARFLEPLDAELVLLQRDSRVVDWLHNINLLVGCGDDFE